MRAYLWAAELDALEWLTGGSMQTTTTAVTPAVAPPPATTTAHRGRGLAVTAAILAFGSAALGVGSMFPRWDATTSLHDGFYNIVNNLMFVAVLLVAGVFLLLGRSQWVRTAAALLLVGTTAGYLPGIGSDIGTSFVDGGVSAGFWIGQASNVMALAAAVVGLIYALRSGSWSWRPSARVEAPVLTGAIGLFGVLLVFSWTLSETKVFDSTNTLVTETFGPFAARLGESSGFLAGSVLVVVGLLVAVCTRPAALSGFLLIGLTVSGVAKLFGFDQWGFEAAQGGTVGPGPGLLLAHVATLGLLFVGVALATERIDAGAEEDAPRPDTLAPAAPATTPTAPTAYPTAPVPPPPAPIPPPPPPAPSPETQAILAELDDLHARGLLSDAERAAKRSQALDGS